MLCIVANETSGCLDLLDNLLERDTRTQVIADNADSVAGSAQMIGDERRIVTAARLPVAAMHEHAQRSVIGPINGAVDVNLFEWSGTVRYGRVLVYRSYAMAVVLHEPDMMVDAFYAGVESLAPLTRRIFLVQRRHRWSVE